MFGWFGVAEGVVRGVGVVGGHLFGWTCWGVGSVFGRGFSGRVDGGVGGGCGIGCGYRDSRTCVYSAVLCFPSWGGGLLGSLLGGEIEDPRQREER